MIAIFLVGGACLWEVCVVECCLLRMSVLINIRHCSAAGKYWPNYPFVVVVVVVIVDGADDFEGEGVS